MTHPSRKKLAGSVFTMGYAMFLVQFGSVSTVYCLRCLFRCCRYMLFLLLTGLFLLLAPFSLKQPNPVFADCRHLLHQNLNISWETSRNTSPGNLIWSKSFNLLLLEPLEEDTSGVCQGGGKSTVEGGCCSFLRWPWIRLKLRDLRMHLVNLCMNHRRLFATRLPDMLLFSPVCLNSWFWIWKPRNIFYLSIWVSQRPG